MRLRRLRVERGGAEAACAPGSGSEASEESPLTAGTAAVAAAGGRLARAVVRGAVARPDPTEGRSRGGTAGAAEVVPGMATRVVLAGVDKGAATAGGAARACCGMHPARAAVGSAVCATSTPAALEALQTAVPEAARHGVAAGRLAAGEISPSCKVAGLGTRGGLAAPCVADDNASAGDFLGRRLPNLFLRLCASSREAWTACGGRCRDMFRRGTLRTVGAPDKLRSP